MRESTRSKGAFVLLTIVVVFALMVGLFGEMLDFYRPGPDIPYARGPLFGTS